VPVILLQRKKIYTLVKRTPGKPPTPARAVLILPQSLEQSLGQFLSPPMPPSIAPARLYKGKGGRERIRTTKGIELKAIGLLVESQPRE
jgi:hypothetical protein